MRVTDEERRNRNPKPEALVSKLSDHPQIRPSELELNHVYVVQGPRFASSLNYVGVLHTVDPRTLDALVVHHFHGPRVNLNVFLAVTPDGAALRDQMGNTIILRKYTGPDQ